MSHHYGRFLWVLVIVGALAGVVVSSAAALRFSEESRNPPIGTVGVAYSHLFVEYKDSGCGPGKQTFEKVSGGLPPGLTLALGGQLTGVPTQAGTFSFYVEMAEHGDAPCAGGKTQEEFTITIVPGLAKLTIGPESTLPGTTGTPYSLQMTATVADPKTWTINSGALPPGLAIDGSTGLVSGTPTTAGTYTFEVLAKMNGDTRSDTKALGIVVRDPLTILGSDPFTAARRAVGEITAPFDAVLAASGGDGTYVWSLTSGALPPGLSMVDGAIAGVPTTSGAYPFTATVTDSEARVANYSARIVVAEKLTVSTLLLRPGKVGKLYAAKVATSGGVKPATWRILVGPLPRGVRFDRTTGALYGIPTKPGRYRLTFEATDSLGVKAKKTLAILVAPAPAPKKKK